MNNPIIPQILRQILRTFSSFTRLLLVEILTGVLIVQLVLPPQIALAAPPQPDKTEGPESSEDVDAKAEFLEGRENPLEGIIANLPVEDSTPLIEAQNKRYELLGLDPTAVLNDPYFVNSNTQWGEVSEERENETKTRRYEFGKLNEDFGGAPRNYSLDKDVQVEVVGDKVVISLAQDFKWGKKTFRRVTTIPGVQSVSKTSAFLKILLKNGEIRTLIGANSRLFEFSELADGGSLMWAVTNVLTDKSLYDSTGLLRPEIRLRNYDARNREMNLEELDRDIRNDLRYGDVEIVDGNNKKTVDVDLLGPTAAGVLAHLELLEIRQEILNASLPLSEILEAQATVARLAAQRPEILPVGSNSADALKVLSNPGLSSTARRTATPWKNHPLELPQFKSPGLDQMRQFAEAIAKVSKDPDDRSTYPVDTHRSGEPSEEFVTREDKVLADSSDALERAKALSIVQATDLKGFRKLLSNHKNKMVIAASFAFMNGVIYLLPNTPFFLESRLFNIDWGSFTNPITGNPVALKAAGPHVPYILKFWLYSAGTAATTFFGIPIAFSYLSDKIMGRNLPHGREAGMRETLKSGWHVFSTFGLRLSSYLLISWRDATVRVIANTVPAIRGIAKKIPLIGAVLHTLSYPVAALTRVDGLPKVLQAMRFGQSPGEYLSHSDIKSEDAPLVSRIRTIVQNIRGSSNTDPATLQGHKEELKLLSHRLGLLLTMKAVADKQWVKSDKPMELLSLRREIGEERFALLEERFAATSDAIYRQILTSNNVDLSNMEELHESVSANLEVRDILKNLDHDFRYALKEQKRSLTLEKVWPKLAGSNAIFFRFKNGETSPANATIWSANFSNDVGLHPVWMGITPGDDAFASSRNSADLMASDQGVVLGVAGTIATVEQTINVFAWLGNLPTDELTYGNAVAVRIPEDHLNPNRSTTVKNPLYKTIRSHNNASLMDSMRAYMTWMNPVHADFWTSWERLGGRITKDQLRTWKNFVICGTVLTFAGLMMQWSTLPPEHQVLSTAFIASGVKSLLFNTYAYATYRIFWMGHSIGVRNMESEPEAKSKQLMELVVRIREELLREEMKPERLTRAYEQLVVFYDQAGKEIPREVRDKETLREKADLLTVHAIANPPFKTAAHPFATVVTNQLMTAITTLIGTFGSALSWKYAFDFSWGETGLILGGLYAFGRGIGFAGGNLRAHLTYRPAVAKLRESIERLEKEDNTKHRTEVFENLLALKTAYERYGREEVVNNNGFVRASPSSKNLLEIARHVYRSVVETPVTDNRATRKASSREKCSAFFTGLAAK